MAGRLRRVGSTARRASVLGALGVAGLGVGGLVALAAASPWNDVLPDLVADEPTRPYLGPYVDEQGSRLVLRFDGYIHNAGAGPLRVYGTRDVAGPMTMAALQRIDQLGGGAPREVPIADSPAGPRIAFEANEDHLHYHFRAAARYSLWNEAKTAEVAPAMKVGFCLEDTQRVTGSVPKAFSIAFNRFCWSRHHATTPDEQPEAQDDLEMGVSAGWRDVYGRSLSFQWVDVSDVAPGRYYIAAEVDPDNVVVEEDEANVRAFTPTPFVIPGFVATPVQATVPNATPTQVTLEATRHVGPTQDGAFRIVSAPQHGTLSHPVGAYVQGPVTYTPDPGYAGPDSFAYVALDLNNPEFPRNPPAATASLTVGDVVAPAPTVALSGAPASMLTGTAVQLTATVAGSGAGVVWSVDGVPGGSDALGTVSATGLYRAPATAPAAGAVTVRATLADRADVFAAAAIGIQQAPAPRPAPTPTDPIVEPPRPPVNPARALKKPLVSRRGRIVYVQVVPQRAGRLTVTAVGLAKRRVARCVLVTPARRVVLCRFRLPASVRPASVRVTAQLRLGGKVLGTVRAAVR